MTPALQDIMTITEIACQIHQVATLVMMNVVLLAEAGLITQPALALVEMQQNGMAHVAVVRAVLTIHSQDVYALAELLILRGLELGAHMPACQMDAQQVEVYGLGVEIRATV